ncbi:DUF453-domain-containing protein [Auricularia subglabra TFB-10046 SS5]|nr:DUF453-domain-containing protein [Auricularia subglabra TFB-10046 SS5]
MIRTDARIPNPLPAAFLRGGTSKGVFVNARHLPMDDRDAWAPVFLRLMGSPDAAYGRQLDGMGGGISSLSKVMVVGPPTTADEPVDAEYTFAQIGVRDDVVDYTGNCGNLSSVAGVFAVDEGICKPEILDGEASSEYARARVRLWNTNTRKRVDTTFPVLRASLKPVLNLEEAAIAGVPGRASQIILDFVSPAGARTGTLLPSGKPTETIQLDDGTEAAVTLMDCANPSVLVDLERSPSLFASQAHAPASALSLELDGDAQLMKRLELLRQEGARRMGLPPDAQAQPKIALVSGARAQHQGQEDVCVRALSMGVPHKAVPMTLGLCVGVAARVPGTVVSRHLGASQPREFVGIQHPGGLVEVGARFNAVTGAVLSANVLRTGRRLMQGAVYWD